MASELALEEVKARERVIAVCGGGGGGGFND